MRPWLKTLSCATATWSLISTAAACFSLAKFRQKENLKNLKNRKYSNLGGGEKKVPI
jgi:hypothetical protein